LLVCPLRGVAFTPRTDHSLMNASSDTIVVDIRSSAQTITRFRALPGSGVTFDGTFWHLTVYMTSGKVLSLDSRQLRELRGGMTPSSGAWLVKGSAVRSISSR